MSANKPTALKLEIEKPISKGVIVETQHVNGEFVSPIFTES